MLQRWMITLMVSAVGCVLVSSCGKKNYSPDEPLPTVYTPSVFISSQNQYLYAIDPVSGTEKWEFNLHGTTQATPVVVGRCIYVPTVDGLYKLDVNTGKQLYSNQGDSFKGIVSSPVTDGRLVYIASNNASGGSLVMALDPNNDSKAWAVSYNTTINSSLTLYQNKLFVAQNDGTINCISTGNGTPVWTTPGSVPVIPGVGLFSSPAVSYPYLYVGSSDGNLYALYLNNGAAAWNFAAGNIINSSPIVYGGNVVFGCNDNYVYCVDSVAKTIRWRFKTADRVISSPSANKNVIYIGGYDGIVYALNVVDGTVKWKYSTNALLRSSVLNVDGDIYAASFDKNLYKLDTSGHLKWKYNVNGVIESSPVLYDYNSGRTYYPAISGMYQ